MDNSIIGGAKARELFEQLNEQDYTNVVSAEVSKIQFRLRYCYNRRHGMTGGMALIWWSELNNEFSKRTHGTIRIKSDIKSEMQKAVSRAITRTVRFVANEARRIEAVARVAEKARPLHSEAFSDWVEEWEKRDKIESAYTSMTIPEAEKWLKRLEDYEKKKVDAAV